MPIIADTPSQYFIELGEARGEAFGKIAGSLETLEGLKNRGCISESDFEAEAAPLREELARLAQEA